MLPDSGTPLQHWELQPDDFGMLDGYEGNGYNLIALAHVWFGMLGDSPVDNHKPYKVCAKFYKNLSYYPALRETISEFSDLANLLMQGIRVDRLEGGPDRYDQPLFRQFAKTPIFREFMHWYRTGDAVTWDYIIDFLTFGKKAEIIDESLIAKAIENTLTIEEEQREKTLRGHILEDLRRLVVMSGFRPSLEDFRLKFGPGQVAEVLEDKSILAKVRALRFTPIQAQVLMAVHYAQHDKPGRRYMLPDAELNMKFNEKLKPRLEALYRVVPKNNGSARSISFEPNSNMALQQGLLASSLAALARSELATHINLKDQTLNREVARLGSLTGDYVTNDMKDASDRLMWDLAAAIFPAEYAALLNAVSSDTVEFAFLKQNVFLELTRAFPQGNALNSFIQSVSFMCIVALAKSLHTRGKDVNEYIQSERSVVRRWPKMDGSFRAFGDDLTYPEALNRNVQALLTELGFVVNVDKTFSGDQAIRESCGGFFKCKIETIEHDGCIMIAQTVHEFVPLRFKVSGLRDGTHDSWLGLISLANRALKKNYFNTWIAIRDLLPEHSFVNVQEDGEYKDQGCALIGNTQVHEPVSGWYRYNSGLQRHERRVLTGRPKPKDYSEVAVMQSPYRGEYASPIDEFPLFDAKEAAKLIAKSGECESFFDVSGRRRSGKKDMSPVLVPVIPSLENYCLGNWLYNPSETEGPGSSPRTGIEAPDVAVWIWTPYSTT